MAWFCRDREIQFFDASSYKPYCQISSLVTVPLKLDYWWVYWHFLLSCKGDNSCLMNIICQCLLFHLCVYNLVLCYWFLKLFLKLFIDVNKHVYATCGCFPIFQCHRIRWVFDSIWRQWWMYQYTSHKLSWGMSKVCNNAVN